MFINLISRKSSILFFIILISKLNAQLDFRRAAYGAVAGPNYSIILHAHNPSSERYSFFSGIFARIPIGIECACDNPKFYIQAQLEYIQSGEKGGEKTLYANNFLSLPIYIKAYPIKYNENSFFFIQAGPRFSYLVKQRVVNPAWGRPYAINQDGKANNFDFSVSVASGISFTNRKNELLLRYDYSFTNALPNLDESEATGDPLARLRKIQHILSIGFSRVLF